MDIDSFILGMNLDIYGLNSMDEFIRKLTEIEKAAKRAGYSIDQIHEGQKRWLGRRFAEPTSANGLSALGTSYLEEYLAKSKSAEESLKYRQDRQNLARMQRLSGIVNPFAFISPQSGIRVQQLLNNVSRIAPKLQGFSLLFQMAKGSWDFAESIAKLNTKILQLGYTSGLGAQRLKDLGAAVTAFGGSAETVAQGSERFLMQIEKLKRGGGLGFLGEVAYKYGFGVDLTADWEQNTQAAISHARRMMAMGDRTGAMSFLKDWDSANYKSNLMKASMPSEQVAEQDAFYKSYDALGDQRLITEETQKFNIESAMAQRSWEAITNQIASVLLPVMTWIMSLVTKITNAIAKTPAIIHLLVGAMGAIAAAMAVMITRNSILIAQAGIRLAMEKGITWAKIAGAIASGSWVTAALAAAIIGGTVAIGASVASGVGGGNQAGKTSTVSEEGEKTIPIADIISGKYSLADQTKTALTWQERVAFATNAGKEWDVDQLNQTCVSLSDVLVKVAVSAERTNEALSDMAKAAISIQEAEQLATMMSSINNTNIANTTNNTPINIQVAQNFHNADVTDMQNGIYDVTTILKDELSQASRRFNQ